MSALVTSLTAQATLPRGPRTFPSSLPSQTLPAPTLWKRLLSGRPPDSLPPLPQSWASRPPFLRSKPTASHFKLQPSSEPAHLVPIPRLFQGWYMTHPLIIIIAYQLSSLECKLGQGGKLWRPTELSFLEKNNESVYAFSCHF